MKKFIAIRDCLTADKDYLTKGDLLEDFDEIKDLKLLELELVEEFDEVKHSKFLKNNKNSSSDNELLEIIDNLKKEIEEKNDLIKNSESEELKSLVEKQKLEIDEKAKNIDGLMAVIEELKSLVEEAIKSKQGQIPEGFVKYKES